MRYILTFLIIIFGIQSFGQTKADSIIAVFEASKGREDSQNALNLVFDLFDPRSTEESRKTALKVLEHIKKKGDNDVAVALELGIAMRFINSGDYSMSLQMTMPNLELALKQKDSIGIYTSYQIIADAYLYSRNYDKALVYYQKIIDLAHLQKDYVNLALGYNMLGDIYAKKKLPDSGLVYTQKAMTVASEEKNQDFIKYIYAITAENYIAKKEYDLAMPFLIKSLKMFKDDQVNDGVVGGIYNDFAEAFMGMKSYDSVYFYSQKALEVNRPIDWKDQLLRSYEYLYKTFEATNKPDSTYKYYRLANVLKDSLFDIEKVKSIESISFQEQIKEQEQKLELAKVEEERQHTIQFALLAIGIISFIIIFLLLSRSMITSTRLIKFLSIVALLMVFEFLNLVLHPFLEKITHHSPILMLLCLVCIAALLVPLHHKIEHWATNKLVEKNKKIRLAAAKKTIEQLEANPEN